jgi:cleavage and polyadenylation specificity factor subunit 5
MNTPANRINIEGKSVNIFQTTPAKPITTINVPTYTSWIVGIPDFFSIREINYFPMSASDWSVFESENYDATIVAVLKPKRGVPGTPKRTWVERWMREGMRRSVRAVFIVHSNDIPHLLLFQHKSSGGPVPFLYGGKLQEGEGERDGLMRVLRPIIMKSKAQDTCDWKVGELISKYWRPEFDNNMYPYIPPHVTRPKEEISLFQVVLPPRCVFGLRENESISAVPIPEIVKAPQNWPTIISCIPSLISRFTFYNYVPGRPGPGNLPPQNRR